MPEKDGSEDKKSTKSVVNKKQKQFMNQEEQLDLSSVAESFGGQIVGEPVELSEEPISLSIGGAALLKLLAAGGVTAGLYDYYRKSKGKKGIFPNINIPNIFNRKKTDDDIIWRDTPTNNKTTTVNPDAGVLQSKQTQVGDDTQSRRRKKIQDILKKSGNERKQALDDLIKGNQTKNINKRKTKINPDVDTSFGDALRKNQRVINKKLNPPEVKGDPLKVNTGTDTTGTSTNTNTKYQRNQKPNNKKKNNIITKIIGKTRPGTALRTAGLTTGVTTFVTNLTKKKGSGGGFRLGGLPGTAHNVGRRTNPQ
jgi:hypothetical protein